MAALHPVFFVSNHVVTQIVKAHFVVGTVSNIGMISVFAFFVGLFMDNQTHRKSQKAVYFAHPFRVALGKIVVYRDNMDALTGQCIQIGRKSRHQRFSFTGFHFGDSALVQDNSAHELYREVFHAQNAPGSFPADSKGFRQNIIGCFAVFQAFFKFIGFFPQLGVGHCGVGVLHGKDLVHSGFDSFDFPGRIIPEKFGKYGHRKRFLSFFSKNISIQKSSIPHLFDKIKSETQKIKKQLFR